MLEHVMNEICIRQDGMIFGLVGMDGEEGWSDPSFLLGRLEDYVMVIGGKLIVVKIVEKGVFLEWFKK